ncbi:RNA polymerase sigma factor [Aquimarina megaterium]|uniref:RNA polymerase sigma factor n=1 Tax=Aquimarina megaterium TaxID=1443666 RepID=UPI00046ED6BF|nr:sigma-70 family RNA polymerase sigma factor [Aquimarina megaterium]
MTLEKKWTQFKEGDKDAFQFIYELCVEDMYAYGMKLNPNQDRVKDCIQEVFIDFYEKRSKLATPENVKFYVLKALKNKLLKKVKKEKKNVYLSDFYQNTFTPEYSVEDKNVNLEISENKRNLILSALQTLSPKQKEILYLRFTLDLSYPEISEMVKIDSNSVRKQVYRAIKKLRESKIFEDYQNIILWCTFYS